LFSAGPSLSLAAMRRFVGSHAVLNAAARRLNFRPRWRLLDSIGDRSVLSWRSIDSHKTSRTKESWNPWPEKIVDTEWLNRITEKNYW
jgi:hypothetical protein